MANKINLAEAFYQSIPETLRDLAETQIGQFSELSEPTSEEDAIILSGKFLQEFQNNILVPFSGLPFVSMMLYLGSLNPAVVAGVFTGIESIGSSSGLDVLAPQNGGIYPGYFDAWLVSAPAASAVEVDMDNGDHFDLNQNGSLWSQKWPIPIGSHEATIATGTETKTIEFEVVDWDVYPPDNATVPQEITAHIEIDAEYGVESVSAKIKNTDTGQIINKVLDSASESLWEVLVSAIDVGSCVLILGVSIGARIIELRTAFTVEAEAA